LLITFGGSDEADFTRRALEALAAAEPLDVDLALGPAYPYVDAAREMAARSPHRVSVYAPARDMLPLYRRARVALAAGGITQFELLSSGVPTISVPHVAREEAECAAFAAAGAVLTFPAEELRPGGAVVSELAALWRDEGRLSKLAEAGRTLIDGRGARRIMDVIEELAG
jgi:spore coat polysaccharide biosynthesis predicted glycosyltransferase SpsG